MAEGSYRRKTGRYWIEVREKALAELAELRAERDIKEAELETLNQEVVRLEQAVAGLSPLASDGIDMITVGARVEGIADLGLADACRVILSQTQTYRTARGIRDTLRDSGYNLEQHTNPLASIHGVLKRFGESGVVEVLESEGKTRYRWKTKQRHDVVIRSGGNSGSISAAERAIQAARDSYAKQPASVRRALEEAAKRKF